MSEKLAKAYEGVFAAIPSADKAILDDYWRSVGCRRDGDHYAPALHIRRKLYKPLVSLTRLQRGPMESMISFAMRRAQNFLVPFPTERIFSQCLGDQFLFEEEFVEKAEVPILEIVMAEEIAHCFQAAPTRKRFPEAAAFLGLTSQAFEKEGKTLALKWGFDTSLASDWCANNFQRR
jgi:hypothetical protein